MPIHSYFVLSLFTILGIILLLRILVLRKDSINFLGTPSIDNFFFIFGKLTLFTNWGFFIYKAISPKSGYIPVPVCISWTATILLLIGTLILITAFYNLGKALKVGLPTEETQLKTNGIYQYSRNPLYLGVDIITLGSCLYYPDLINISFGLFGIYIHHLIILGEEKFLGETFGTEWEVYRKKTRRYF